MNDLLWNEWEKEREFTVHDKKSCYPKLLLFAQARFGKALQLPDDAGRHACGIQPPSFRKMPPEEVCVLREPQKWPHSCCFDKKRKCILASWFQITYQDQKEVKMAHSFPSSPSRSLSKGKTAYANPWTCIVGLRRDFRVSDLQAWSEVLVISD